MITEKFDISLDFEKEYGTGSWRTFELWDDKISSHCNIAFKTNTRIMLDVPAELSLEHPTIVEPGEQFYIDASLGLPDNRQLKFFFEFYFKIDLDLPDVSTYIPGLGFVDDFKDTYGGEWEFTFDLNNQMVDQALDKIWLGNVDTLQSFIVDEELNEIVKIDYLNLNPQSLGTLLEGKIRIDILEAILTVGKQLVLIEPFHAVIVGLDWILDNVIETESGFEVCPSVSTEIISSINVGSSITTDYSTLLFNSDMSKKSIFSTVNPSAQENLGYNKLDFNCGPLQYRLNVNADWRYYLDLKVNCLGLNLYENSWNWYLGSCPSYSSQLYSVSQQITPNLKLDEPMQITEPEITDGEINFGLYDNAGVSTVNLLYSTDKIDWKTISLTNNGECFSAAPINEVESLTTVYYYIEAIDGDNDQYVLDNNGFYYSYILEPKPQQEKNSDSQNPLETIVETISGCNDNNLIIFLTIFGVAIISIVLVAVVIKKRRKTTQNKKLFFSQYNCNAES